MGDRDVVLALLQEVTDDVLGEEAPRLSEDLELGEDSIDSLDLIEILMVIEDRTGLLIDGDDVTGITSIAGLIDVILRKQRGKVG